MYYTCLHHKFTDTSKSLQEDENHSTCSDTTIIFDEVVDESNQLHEEDGAVVEVAEVSSHLCTEAF